MRLNILVTGSLYSSQCAFSAWQFCNASISADHTISQVFFYQDGVTQGTALSLPLADEFEPVAAWSKLAVDHDIELVVCVSAAERRGILGEEQAREFQKTAANLHPSFKVAGLGALHEASLDSDRTVTFK